MIRAALFTTNGADLYHDENHIGYHGQRKRKTFDGWFVPTTEFHLFHKDSVFGWEYIGQARVTHPLSDRTEHAPPVWELQISTRPNINPCEGYLCKADALKRAGLDPKYKSMSTGIIPLF